MIVLRGDGTVPQQLAGNKCVFAAIAHGLPHYHNNKTLREGVIQSLEEDSTKRIGGDTVGNWIQPARGHHDSQTTITEYTSALKEGGQGGDFEVAIIADMLQIQITIFIEHDLGYKHFVAHGSEPGQHPVNILRTGDDRYVPFTITHAKDKRQSSKGTVPGKPNRQDASGRDGNGRDDQNENHNASNIPTNDEENNDPASRTKDRQHELKDKSGNPDQADAKTSRHMPGTATHHDEAAEQDRRREKDGRTATWFKVAGVVPMP